MEIVGWRAALAEVSSSVHPTSLAVLAVSAVEPVCQGHLPVSEQQ
jgi:hypothetical protein